jgi:preprotein translocase subunit SecB
MTDESNQAASTNGPSFNIVRIYLKDISFETPNSPAIFAQEFNPEMEMQLNTSIATLEEDVFEVVLTITVQTKDGDKTGFLAEVQQAGIFKISGFDETQKAHMFGAYCPNTLFPFAREEIASLVTKGGFPPLLLAPVNFDALFAQRQNQVAAAESSEPSLQ